MREVVIVPTFQRSDFLYVCLEAIRAAEPLISIHVFPDRGTNESEICEKFGAAHHMTIDHRYHGNSYNVMEALKWSYQQSYEQVYIIEDDAIIDPSFFSWSRAALEAHPDAFAACGWQYSPDAIVGDGPDVLIPWYLSVCAAIPRRSVYGIVQHARPEYYAAMGDYLDRAYSSSFRRGSRHYEQDGLALRVCESEGKRCIWPRRPRAIHCGFHGYHTKGEPLEGTLEERVAVLKMALGNPDLLKRLMSGAKIPELAKCEGCGQGLLSEDRTARVVCRECFHRDNPGLEVTTGSHYYLPCR